MRKMQYRTVFQCEKNEKHPCGLVNPKNSCSAYYDGVLLRDSHVARFRTQSKRFSKGFMVALRCRINGIVNLTLQLDNVCRSAWLEKRSMLEVQSKCDKDIPISTTDVENRSVQDVVRITSSNACYCVFCKQFEGERVVGFRISPEKYWKSLQSIGRADLLLEIFLFWNKRNWYYSEHELRRTICYFWM